MVRNAPMGPPNSYSNDGADDDGADGAVVAAEDAVEADDDAEVVGPAPLTAPATVGGGRKGYLSLGFSRIVVMLCCMC